jgi:hypothetical protein
MSDTYCLNMKCQNCGKEWQWTVPKGAAVTGGAGNSSYLIARVSGNSTPAECPNCGVNDCKKVLP